MKKATFIVLVCGLLFSFTTSEKPNLPDPEAFGKKVVKAISSGDSLLYIQSFVIDSLHYQKLVDDYFQNPYRNKSNDEEILRNIKKAKAVIATEISMELAKNWQIIQLWKDREQVNPAKLQYLATYYEMQSNRKEPFVVLSDAKILTKLDTSFYLFEYSRAILINSEWRVGRLRQITRLSKDFDKELISYSEDGIYNPLNADSTSITEPEPADSSMSYAEPAVTEMRAYSKKQKRINKKVEKLEEKIDKLYRKY